LDQYAWITIDVVFPVFKGKAYQWSDGGLLS